MVRGGTRFALYWLPVLAYVALIFIVSSRPGLEPPFRFPNADKVAHLFEYGVLGLLLVRALRAHSPFRAALTGGMVALLIGFAVGAGDEFWQSFVPGRESTILDWFADALGITFAQIVYLLFRKV
ncbi:MAG: VanZ family protein [Candidatus Eisenbacteria bacterium]|uniref:VanZ family protein n=1 Tax=Eiseniibacteriota bacterium TaxID=2212470 RepID=A0A849SDZ6_UNCEI|nr:VanZ family protein [Candidatus Eisenbacteria bacterium]